MFAVPSAYMGIYFSLAVALLGSCMPSLTKRDNTSIWNRHVAAGEGAYGVSEWLIEAGADVNAMDRADRTPLEVRTRPFEPYN